MVAIGQALMANPRVLMLDEPSGGLAPSIVSEVMAVVSEASLTRGLRGFGTVTSETAS